MARKKDDFPPGAAPNIQGYWFAVWGLSREIPKKFKHVSQEWKNEWLRGYDEYGQFKNHINSDEG